jgi:hypothetical protein
MQHVLPRGFVKTRHYGLLAARDREARLALGRRLLLPATVAARCPAADAHCCGTPIHRSAAATWLSAVPIRTVTCRPVRGARRKPPAAGRSAAGSESRMSARKSLPVLAWRCYSSLLEDGSAIGSP